MGLCVQRAVQSDACSVTVLDGGLWMSVWWAHVRPIRPRTRLSWVFGVVCGQCVWRPCTGVQDSMHVQAWGGLGCLVTD